MSDADELIHYDRFSLSAGWEPVEARVIAERAVALSVNGQPWLSFACTPDALETLAAGFLFNEGFIEHPEEIAVLDVCAQKTHIDVWLTHVVERPETWQRTSGCTGGVTGRQTKGSPVKDEGTTVAPSVLLAAMDQLLKSQELYRSSGGVHCSAAFDGPTIIGQAEDIGRHNTLDKLAGQMLLSGRQPKTSMVLTTGRISTEMLQKSARMGAAVVVSRTSPTSQSIQQAEALGVTLVGYARRGGFLVYSHPHRLQG